ncbi:MAG: pyridoxamine 5'-phosphate oxidase family protein [Clostridia bacterium]|nr:pyridoxamine 5'-phosphate oxidase family protein [Clostridia bacterium]
MQHRMKEFTMTTESIDALLERGVFGHISTFGQDGYPYTVPVHFVYDGGCIYFHGLPAGDKLDNIKANPKVCFETCEFNKILDENLAIICDIDSAYECAVIRGTAEFVTDMEEKTRILNKFVDKYAPHLKHVPMPEGRIMGTACVKITPESCTGKYHV